MEEREDVCGLCCYLDAQHTLTEHDVAHSAVNVLLLGGTGGDHVAVAELHRLGALSAQLAAHNHLATLSTVLHDETEHTVARAGTAESKTSLG